MGSSKRYRIIYNNDGGEVNTPAGATAEDFLDARMNMLANTQVDMISYCSHYSFGSCLHKSSVGTVPTPVKNRGRQANAQALIDSGRDCLQITVDWAHENGIDVAWSMRMNDCHDGKIAISEIRSKFKRDHPEYLIGREEDASTPEKFVGNYRWWAGVNYAIPEVQQKALAMIREVCENYDIDGIELDWNRHNVYRGYPLDASGSCI